MFCGIAGCEKPVKARGLCMNHYNREWRRRNPNYASEWRAAHPGYQTAKANEWRFKNPEAQKRIEHRYYANNRAKVIERNTSRSRGLRSASSQTLDYRLILTCDPCSYCGSPTTDIDHIEPVRLGGSNEWHNLTAACGFCNSSKGTKRLLEFMR